MGTGLTMDPILDGYLEARTLSASGDYTPQTQRATVTVTGTVQAHAVENLTVRLVLAAQGCAKHGPQGEPENAIAATTLRLRDPAGNETLAYSGTLSGTVPLGSMYSVYVRPAAENVIGPIFGQCREFRAV